MQINCNSNNCFKYSELRYRNYQIRYYTKISKRTFANPMMGALAKSTTVLLVNFSLSKNDYLYIACSQTLFPFMRHMKIFPIHSLTWSHA